jgi:hypothetical protein
MEKVRKMINYSIPGWMSDSELMWLHETSKQMKSVLEIGSFKGRSTYALCTGCPGPVFAIDMFQGDPAVFGEGDFYREFYVNVGHFKNLVTYRMDSFSAAQFFKPKSIDMIFIDGDHAEAGVITDLKAWWLIGNKLICGHDLRPESEIETALKKFGINYSLAIDSIWKCEIN